MNWQSFGVVGYLSVAMSVGTLLLWVIYLKKPARIVARVAMLLAVLACAGAKLNSVTHVNRIEVDPAEQQAIAKAREDQRRKAALDSRGEEVADIRFAEDAEGEFYDRAGMDEADLKYLEGGDAGTPDWKKQKRQRGSGDAADDSLEGMIGAKEDTEGVKADAVTEKEREPAALMSSGDLAIANHLDRWNLDVTFALAVLSLLVLVHDYLRRANIYQEASLPLPIPCGLRDSVTPMPAVVTRPEPPRREIPDELAWLLKRGESFVYFAEDHAAADGVMARLEPLVARSREADLIRIGSGGDEVSDEFVFEALWHGRASFVIDESARVDGLLDCFVRMLDERRTTRARAMRDFHLVWDRSQPVPASLHDKLIHRLQQTGGSLFLLRSASR